jgi:hypothetical protein
MDFGKVKIRAVTVPIFEQYGIHSGEGGSGMDSRKL